MRVHIMTAPAFVGEKVIAAIPSAGSTNERGQDMPVASFLWKRRGAVPFVKVDEGLEGEADGVMLMKPMPGLEALLGPALQLGVQMRSVISLPSEPGIASVGTQQCQVAKQIASYGLVPIIEPEVLVNSPDKVGAEVILLAELTRKLDALPHDRQVMLKLTIPLVPDFYAPLVGHACVARLLALSGGYTQRDACRRLAANQGMIASFSRALVEGLTRAMSDDKFGDVLAGFNAIYRASSARV